MIEILTILSNIALIKMLDDEEKTELEKRNEELRKENEKLKREEKRR